MSLTSDHTSVARPASVLDGHCIPERRLTFQSSTSKSGSARSASAKTATNSGLELIQLRVILVRRRTLSSRRPAAAGISPATPPEGPLGFASSHRLPSMRSSTSPAICRPPRSSMSRMRSRQQGQRTVTWATTSDHPNPQAVATGGTVNVQVSMQELRGEFLSHHDPMRFGRHAAYLHDCTVHCRRRMRRA